MKKRNILLFLIIPTLLIGQTKKQFKVKYISSENIYLDAGSDGGLNIGDSLVVKRGVKIIAGLHVAFVAEHSSSCKIINQKEKIQRGDLVFLIKTAKKQIETVQKTESRKRIISKKIERKTKKKRFARISGSASFQGYFIKDLQETKLNFNQRTIRLNLKMKKIWGKEYNFRIRTRSRYNQRKRRYSSYVPKNEWRNRIYTVSFSYDNDEAPINYKLGRIISNKFSGVGYIDGMLIQGNLTSEARVGMFAGSQPEWRYSQFDASIQKYGAYFNFVKGDYRQTRFETTVAAAGEYHGSMVSREFFYFQNNFFKNKKWNLYQSAELDINRKWRRDKTNESVSLTNLYISANFNFTNWMSTSLTYDNRKRYWNYDTRSIADSLFDAAFRHGLRANFNMRVFNGYRIFTNIGFRKRETDTNYTYSYAGGISKYNILKKRIFFSFYFSGFSNYFADGYSPSIRLGKSFSSGHTVNIVYGNYLYKLKSNTGNNINQWLRLDGVIELLYRFYLSGQYSYNWGENSKDQRLLMELGYRF